MVEIMSVGVAGGSPLRQQSLEGTLPDLQGAASPAVSKQYSRVLPQNLPADSPKLISLAQSLANSGQLESFIASLTPQEAIELKYLWEFWARPNQLPPNTPWTVWLCLAGRGWGKTRVGAEWVQHRVDSGKARRIALSGRTSAEVRDIIVDGESGILNTAPPWSKPEYQTTKRRLVWPNGAIALLYSADEPDQARGGQHDTVWGDELAAWRFPEAWAQLMFGLRLSSDPRALVTTTPRPTPIIRELIARPTTYITRGSTHENARNLAPTFLDEIVAAYKGTRMERQEIYGEILDDVPGALWTYDNIAHNRVLPNAVPDIKYMALAVDPSVTAGDAADSTGIVIGGLGVDHQAYIFGDYTFNGTPDEWASRAVKVYHNHKCDRLVAEVNNGGDLVERIIRAKDPNINYKKVSASRGKVVRAAPVSALYEQNKIHHVGSFPDLEEQMCAMSIDGYMGLGSPDRVDALVWLLTELMLGARNDRNFAVW